MRKTKSAADFSKRGTSTQRATKTARTAKPKTKADTAKRSPGRPRNKRVAAKIGNGTVLLEKLRLCDIDIHSGTQARQALNEETITDYAEILEDALREERQNPFPAVDVFRTPEGKNYLADGFHRYHAHSRIEQPAIECKVHHGTLQDAIVFACQANETHGLRRTNADKRNAVKMVLAIPEYRNLTNVDLAAMVNVSETYVRQLRTVAQQRVPVPVAETPKPSNVRVDEPEKQPLRVFGDEREESPEFRKTETQEGSTEDNHGVLVSPPTALPETGCDEELFKLGEVLGSEGAKVLAAIRDGSLELTPKDVRDWACGSDHRIRQILPFIVEYRWKPKKAYQFIDEEISEKTKTELVLRAIAAGGELKFATDGYSVTVEKIR